MRQLLPEELLHDAKYEIGGQIAQGGMGAILNAKEVAIRREVAMKVMLESSGQEDLVRFVEEAQITGQLEHPNIVPVHELSVDENDQIFYTMKMVRGVTLRRVFEWLAEGAEDAVRKYPLSTLLTIFQKVCDALAFAHSRGVIHRDLKPENIMLGDFGEVLVMDWGLAKLVGRVSDGRDGSPSRPGALGENAPPIRAEDPTTASRTLAGTIMGTPQYMAPEQARGEIAALDARSDIYALGAILYHLLVLRPPIDAVGLEDILEKARAGQIIPPIRREPPVIIRRNTAPATAQDSPAPPVDLNAPTVLQTTPPEVAGSAGSQRSSAARPAPGPPRQRARLHLPDGELPESLNAVVMKAMALEPARRYASVAELQADITAYQTGFATGAENANLAKQLVLLIKRHKGVFSTAATAGLVICALIAWSFINITRERNIAAHERDRATQNEKVAQTNEKRAVASEQEAVAEKEAVRRALARSALALAEAAYREADGPAMQAALDQVPADLRDANWSYLLEQSDTSVARLKAFRYSSLTGHPKLPSVFAVAGDKSRVTLLNVRTGERLLQFSADVNPTPSRSLHLVFSPDGERIAVSESGDGKTGGRIAIHNTRDGSKLLAWDSPAAWQLEFSADGRRLLQLGVSPKESLTIWDATTGEMLWSSNENKRVNGGFLNDGRRVLVTSGERAFVLNTDDWSQNDLPGIKLSYITTNIGTFAIRPDGRAFLWTTGEDDLRCEDLTTGRLLFSNHNSARLQRVMFTPDGKRFVCVGELPDGRQSIVVCDAQTGAPLRTLLGGSGRIGPTAIHPISGELLVEGRIWDVTDTPARWAFSTPKSDTPLHPAMFWATDDVFVGPKSSAQTLVLNLPDLTTLWRPTVGNNAVLSASADGHTLALATNSNSNTVSRRVQIVRYDSGKISTVGEFEVGGRVRSVRLSPTGDRAVFLARTKRPLAIVDSSTGAPLMELERTSLPEINDFQWLWNGRQCVSIATANKARGFQNSEERIIVWDAASGKQVRSVVHPTALDCLVVAPDGKRFAAAGADKLVHVFDVETLEERQAFRAHDGPITALAWHPSRPIVATGSADLTIKVWNLDTGKRLETLRGPTAAPRMLNFSPSGQRLACASEDRMVRIWEPKALQNAVLDAPAPDGWEDLLAQLKADEVKANGWTLSGGLLLNPKAKAPPFVLPGGFARSSYLLRANVRHLGSGLSFNIAFPVGDRQAIFQLDYPSDDGVYRTGLGLLGSRTMKEIQETVTTRQVNDGETHDLEITVSLGAKVAQIKAALDDRPIYEWSGLADEVRMPAHWPALPSSSVALGWNNADWVVSAVKVKRLDTGK